MADDTSAFATPDPLLLERYVARECTPAESGEIEAWISAHPERRAFVGAMRTAWLQAGQPDQVPAYDVDTEWRRFAARSVDQVGDGQCVVRTRPARRVVSPRRSWTAGPRIAAAAAVLVCCVGAGLLVRTWRPPTPASRAEAAERTYATRRAERADFRLADGTRVLLGPASRLRIPASYGAASRDLFLEGDAYFEVTHDATRPMRVHAAHAVMEDLGTRFVVSTRRENPADVVAVSEGIVALRAPGGGRIVLRARDVGRASPGGILDVQRQVSLIRYMGWVDGMHRFDDVPLPEVVRVLERQYDVDIHVRDASFAGRRLTVTFHDGNVDEQLSGLAFLLNAHYVRRGRDVTFTAR